MKLLQSYLKNKPSSQSPEGIVNHELFLKKIELKQQASSYKPTSGRVGPQSASKFIGWVGPKRSSKNVKQKD